MTYLSVLIIFVLSVNLYAQDNTVLSAQTSQPTIRLLGGLSQSEYSQKNTNELIQEFKN
jgi:hypothetical protein